VPLAGDGLLLMPGLLSLVVSAEVATGVLSAGQLRCWYQRPGSPVWLRYPEQDLQAAGYTGMCWSRLLPACGSAAYLPHGLGAGPVQITLSAFFP